MAYHGFCDDLCKLKLAEIDRCNIVIDVGKSSGDAGMDHKVNKGGGVSGRGGWLL